MSEAQIVRYMPDSVRTLPVIKDCFRAAFYGCVRRIHDWEIQSGALLCGPLARFEAEAGLGVFQVVVNPSEKEGWLEVCVWTEADYADYYKFAVELGAAGAIATLDECA